MRFRLSSSIYPTALLGLLSLNLGQSSLAAFSASAVACYQTVASGEYSVAIRHCEMAAQQGDSEAQYKLAALYAQGHGSKQDYVSSAKWLTKAAAQGHLKSQYELAFAYYHGYGLTANPVQAAFWYKKAANKNHETSQRNLAHMYELGDGIPVDLGKAYYWYRKLAEQNNSRAQLRTGLMLLKGQGVKADQATGRQWITKAANAEDQDAAYILGLLLIEDQPNQAMNWYRRASQQGHILASYNLANYLYQQDPDSTTLKEAKQLAELAIKNGHKESVKLLSLIEQLWEKEATTTAVASEQNAVQRLLALSPKTHTIQLISLSSAQRAEDFINRHNINAQAFHYPIRRDDHLIYIVIYGEYPNRDTAKQAVRELPSELQATKPFVKKIAVLQQALN